MDGSKRVLAVGLGAALLLASSAHSEFEMSVYTMGGGGVSVGGGFSLGGSVGQVDTSTPATGEGWAMSDDFWADVDVCLAFEADGMFDLADYQRLELCVAGPGQGVSPGCSCADLDANGSVDLVDFAVFQVAFTGQ